MDQKREVQQRQSVNTQIDSAQVMSFPTSSLREAEKGDTHLQLPQWEAGSASFSPGLRSLILISLKTKKDTRRSLPNLPTEAKRVS